MESQPGDHRKFVDENLREQFLAGMDLVSAKAKLETSETVNDASVAIGGTYQILLQSKEVKTTHDLNGLFMIFYVMAIQSRNGPGPGRNHRTSSSVASDSEPRSQGPRAQS